MASNTESFADIVKKVRSGDYGCEKCGDLCDCPNAEKIITSIVNRLGIAHKREMDNRAILAGASLADAVESNLRKERDALQQEISRIKTSDDVALARMRGDCDVLRNERDELKAKLATSQNYEDVIAAKDREIEAVKDERNRLNAKVNELIAKVNELNEKLDGDATANGLSPATMKLLETEKRLASAERCIGDIEAVVIGWSHEMQGGVVLNIIRAYREKKGDNQ